MLKSIYKAEMDWAVVGLVFETDLFLDLLQSAWTGAHACFLPLLVYMWCLPACSERGKSD
jgi:hypothetical protein